MVAELLEGLVYMEVRGYLSALWSFMVAVVLRVVLAGSLWYRMHVVLVLGS